ncbi:uncharacterized protein LOC111714927, partial [Eurytemora carolleeae]|uniref:uncharacterized protein LOC111714927 n=1 Tax=Eurytemora carolleeae TaxID=1294199 RepID=UPI000C77DCE2
DGISELQRTDGRIVPSSEVYPPNSANLRRDKERSRLLSVLPTFDDSSVNNSLVNVRIGETIHLSCRIFMLQDSLVTWGVQRKDTIDLLTVGNTTFTGDNRYSVQFQNPTDWVLRIENVESRDAGKFICTLQTYPKQTLIVFLQVDGPVIEIRNSSEGFVYSAGSHINLDCIYRNRTKDERNDNRTPHPLLPIPLSTQLPSSAVRWTLNNKPFSLRNRKRVKNEWTGDEVHSYLTIKSSIKEDSGNYTCTLPHTNISSTVQIQILKGEHSEAVLTESQTSNAADCSQNIIFLLVAIFYNS